MCVKVIVCYISVVFLRHNVVTTRYQLPITNYSKLLIQ